ncbi:hypothetical protein PMI14_03058 [Acidovorax sp. CF316]|uniref:SHOCT domain-containing protein n=1 Tax=Acidovorax sp. CF316 TaxID=1144317 RepID=UPI00026BCB65|nr:SHOCT domain-containing protein [Acidovorax sp. CF316]EJE52255.1 hypothetical protein PMI14_03058 [Acidovorax sp. CF316]
MQTIAKNLAVAAMALCAAAACAQQSQNMEAMNRGVFSDVPAPPLGGSVKDAAAKKRGSLQPGTGDFYRFAKIEASPVSQEASPMDLRRWTLSALVSKATGEVEFYLHYYEIYRASSWKAFSAAQTDAGENLKLGRIGARVVSCRSGCSYAEELFIDLAPGTVERARTQPLRIQLSGLGANATLVEVGAQAVNDLVAKAELEAMKYRKAGASAGVVPALASEPSMPAAATPALVADELQKLARLRAAGTITEQEFQGLKAKLLAR